MATSQANSRLMTLVYGIIAYIIGLGGLTWFILYIGGWSFLPFNIDSVHFSNLNSTQPVHLASAISINVALLLLFGVQHSAMARPSFKKQWTKIIPKSAERSTYVLASGLLMALICLFWQPLNGVIWRVDSAIGSALLIALYIAGWSIAVISTFLINHFELFGLQQSYYHYLNKKEPKLIFVERAFYKVVRHPLQFGILVGIWATPLMTATHFMLSIGMTAYVFIGLYFEERDLADSLGEKYKRYQERVPFIVPGLKGSPEGAVETEREAVESGEEIPIREVAQQQDREEVYRESAEPSAQLQGSKQSEQKTGS